MNSSQQHQRASLALALVAICVLPAFASDNESQIVKTSAEAELAPAEDTVVTFSELLARSGEEEVARVSQLLILRDQDSQRDSQRDDNERPESNTDLDPEPAGEDESMELDDEPDRDSDAEDGKDNEDDAEESDSDRGLMAYVENGRFVLPDLSAPSISTTTIGNGSIPKGFREGKAPPIRVLPESGQERQLDDQTWAWSVKRWSAANTFSHPRYYEDRMLERHGVERFPELQPLCSGARFFATIPMMPYLMTVNHPCECESTLGYFRSGSCVRPLRQRPPYSRRAVVAEAATISGMIIAIP